MHKRKGAFTLVELIVVITILAILGTIAFLSFQWYSKSSRDSVRIQDLASTRKVLELFILEKWFYPLPTDVTEIVYSWATAWHQWSLWDRVIENVWKISKKPVDPLFDTEYGYSVTDLKNEYELWWVLEWWGTAYNVLTNNTYAAEGYRALVNGDYNGKIISVSTGWTDFVLAIPSIMVSDISNPDVDSIISDKKFVYNNEANLPSAYKEVITGFTATWWFDYTPWTDIVVFSGTINDLGTSGGKVEFAKAIQKVYSGTLLAGKSDFQELLAFDAESDTSAEVFAWELMGKTPQFSKELAKVDQTPTDGVCWTAHGANLWSPPTSTRCSEWIPTSVTKTWATYSWTCNGKFWWTWKSCSATYVTNGTCWSGSGSVAPASSSIVEPCSAGTLQWLDWVGSDGNFDWSCNATAGGTINMTCSASKTSWKDLDPNCDIADITIGSQTWAWCNSTLWTWFEWWKKDDGSDSSVVCSDYEWNTVNSSTCAIWATNMASSAKANAWFSWSTANW
jgi:prepilin-type N-terminal cleavage/methylation domain-containing protein